MLSRADRKTLKILGWAALAGAIIYMWNRWRVAEFRAGTPQTYLDQEPPRETIPEVIIYER